MTAAGLVVCVVCQLLLVVGQLLLKHGMNAAAIAPRPWSKVSKNILAGVGCSGAGGHRPGGSSAGGGQGGGAGGTAAGGSGGTATGGAGGTKGPGLKLRALP